MYFSKILQKEAGEISYFHYYRGRSVFNPMFLETQNIKKKLDEVASLVFRPIPCLQAQIHNLNNPLINIVVNSVQTLSNFKLPSTNSLDVAMFQ